MQQAAVIEILRVMADSPADVTVVLNAIAKQAARLCDAPFARVTVVEGDVLRVRAGYVAPRQRFRSPAQDVPLSRTSIQGRALIERKTLHFADIAPLIDKEFPDARENASVMGFRAVLAVPLVRGDEGLGAMFLYRREPGLFAPDQVALVETFARQAAIALHNVRQFHATREALEQQTATSEILRVISSTPNDVRPVFETIAQAALTLCHAVSSTLHTYDGKLLHIGALASTTPEGAEAIRAVFPRPASRDNGVTRAVFTRALVQIPDILEDPDYATTESAMEASFRSVLAVPLMRDGQPIGAISVGRPEPGPYPASQVALLQTFADQAVIAIENVRMFTALDARNRDLTEALEQQTATGDILRVISQSPTDTQPVFDAIAQSAARLCAAEFCHVFRYDGTLLHFASSHGLSEDGLAAVVRGYPLRPGRASASARAVLSGCVEQIEDVHADPDYEHAGLAKIMTFKSIVAVPMLHHGVPVGAIALAQSRTGAFPLRQVELLKTFADQAVIAIENVRLFNELGDRNLALSAALDQQTATTDVLRLISRSTFDLDTVLQTLIESATRLCEADKGTITRQIEGRFYRAASYGFSREFADYVKDIPVEPERGTVTGRALLEGKVVHIVDVTADREYTFTEAQRIGEFRTALSVPMLREGVPIGVMAVTRSEVRPFTDAQVALIAAFADQAVIAIENVRLFTELEARNRDLTEALEHQTATSEILRVISSTPTDAQPVFETIADRAVALCGADVSVVSRVDDGLTRLAAVRGITQEERERLAQLYPLPLEHGSASGRAVRSRGVAHIPDVLADPDYDAGAAAVGAWRSALAVPMLREGQVIGTIFVGRTAPGLFPDAKVELLKTFADQAVIAIENVRLFTELQARNLDLTTAFERQTATGEVLRVISSSPTDTQPVFDAIVRSAVALCHAQHALIFGFDGEQLLPVAQHSVKPEFAEYWSRNPMRPGRGSVSGRATLERATVHVHDVLSLPDYEHREAQQFQDYRTVLAVPMLRDGSVVGVITMWRAEVSPFLPQEVELVETFAKQAVIAIQNVRLFTELEARNSALTEALEQQTATSEILRVISGSPTDVQPVFNTIANSVLALCRAQFANVFTYDGERIHLAAYVNVHPEYVDVMRQYYPLKPGRATAVARAIDTGKAAIIEDVLADPDYAFAAPSSVGGFRSILAVPLLRDGKPIGGIAIGRPEPGTFPDSQIALLQTFADQAVIAIQNVRLFTELEARNRDLTEALEQQTATSEILRVISRSQTDVQPVFETIVRSVRSLCDAKNSGVYLLDGDTIDVAATAGLSDDERAAFKSGYPRKLGRDTVSGLAAMECRVVQALDLMTDPQYAGAPGTLVGARTVLGVPLMRDGRAIGSIGVWRSESKAFSETQIALLQTFADQAVIAIENVRLFKELQARTAQLTRSVSELQALGEVGRAVSSTLDVETVLGTIVARVRQLTGMDGGSIYEYDEARGEFHLHSADGLPVEVVEALRSAPIRKGEGALGRLATTGSMVEIHDVADERTYQSRVRNALMRIGYRSMLVVPLLRENVLLGGLVVNRRATGAFDASVVALMKTFATQSAIAIQNARLFREIERKSRELESASRHKSEFLANMSHELRTPLNAIIGFSEVLNERLFGELNDKQAEYVVDIADSGRHLLLLINDILDLSKIEAGRMELDASEFDLPRAIGQTLTLVRERAERRAIEISLTVEPGVAAIRADERKVKQVLLNLLSNALKFTPEGGRIAVEAKDLADRVEVAVRDTGVGIAPEDHEKVFEEFRQVGTSAARTEGTGLGLAISRKFIELHGGKLWLASGLGKGSTFTFSLPRR